MTVTPAKPKFHARSLTELLALRAGEFTRGYSQLTAETQADEPAVHTGAGEFGDKLQTLT
jgi:hypothetical protein